MQVGQIIKCKDERDLIDTMISLEEVDIWTDVIERKKEDDPYRLVITDIGPIEVLTEEQIKELMCDDFCRYTHEAKVKDIEVICDRCPLNQL